MPRDKSSMKYFQVKNLIKEKILANEFEEKLPGERILAGMFNVSYMTIRHAIHELA